LRRPASGDARLDNGVGSANTCQPVEELIDPSSPDVLANLLQYLYRALPQPDPEFESLVPKGWFHLLGKY
jgi:hypothetical protein